MSAIVALARLTPGAPKSPAKNRQIQRLAMLLQNPDPRMKMAKRGVVARYTTLRPKVSLVGDAMIGPKAIPRAKVDKGSIARVCETPKSRMTSRSPGAYIEVARVETNPIDATINVVYSFLHGDQLRALRGSFAQSRPMVWASGGCGKSRTLVAEVGGAILRACSVHRDMHGHHRDS